MSNSGCHWLLVSQCSAGLCSIAPGLHLSPCAAGFASAFLTCVVGHAKHDIR